MMAYSKSRKLINYLMMISYKYIFHAPFIRPRDHKLRIFLKQNFMKIDLGISYKPFVQKCGGKHKNHIVKETTKQ